MSRRTTTIDEPDFLHDPGAAVRLARKERKPITIIRMDGTVVAVLSVPGPRRKKAP